MSWRRGSLVLRMIEGEWRREWFLEGCLEAGAYMTMEQTMQARRLRCWPGGTKFSLMVRVSGGMKVRAWFEVDPRYLREPVSRLSRSPLSKQMRFD